MSTSAAQPPSSVVQSPVPVWLRYLPVDIALLALIYFCSARIALLFAFEKTNASPFWPPAGIALAALMILGWRAWWGILVGAVAANLVTFIGNGFQDLLVAAGLSLVIGGGNTVAALAGWLVAGRPRMKTGFTLDGGNALRLLLGAGVAGLVAALVGTSAVTMGGAAPMELWSTILRVWSLGDALGIVVMLPLLLSWWCPEPGDPRRRLAWLPCSLLAILALIQLIAAPASAWPIWAMTPLPFLGLALRSRRACWSTAALAAGFVIWLTIRGAGPLVGADENHSLLNMQLALLGIGALLLADGLLLGQRFQESVDDGVGLLIHGARVPAATGLLPALGITGLGVAITFLTWWSLLRDQDVRVAHATTITALNVREHFVARTTDLMNTLRRMASRWNDAGGVAEVPWRRDAYNIYRDYGCLQAIEWIDRDTVIRWIEPLAGNEAALGMRLSDEPSRRIALERSVAEQRTVVTPVVELKQGGAGFVMYMPVSGANQANGFLVAVFRLGDFTRYLQRTTHAWDDAHYILDLRQDGEVKFSTQSVTGDPATSFSRSAIIDQLGKPLEVRLTPRPELIASQAGALPGLVLNAGLLLSTLLGISIALVGIALAHARRSRVASQAKARFLATMSHEIRTPMNGILGAVELALGRPLDNEARSHLTLVDHSGRTLLAIINDILDFSKIESGQLTLENAAFNIRDLARESVQLFAATGQERGIAVSCAVADNLPPGLLGDPLRLRQVLLNLLSNAMKFTERGSVSLKVELGGGTPERPLLRLICQDTGIGMDAEAHTRLFQPFTQADASTTRRFGGTGLGLSISHQLITLMGGTIRCDSTPGVGTTFTVEIALPATSAPVVPLVKPALPLTSAPPVAPTTATKATVPEAAPSGRVRVLLAEDNLVNQRIAGAMLQRCGCLVDIVADGNAAVAKCAATTYDLVFMDMQMPELDGIEACRRIRAAEAAGRHLPIIALTANAFDEDESACRQAGMDAFLSKPVQMSALKSMVERYASVGAGSGSKPT